MIIPVILCGGAGTRLWPASRQDAPKPFLPLVDGVSTFALTLSRISDSSVFGPAIVVASAAHPSLVDAALATANTKATLLLEPAPRDTMAAIACAASFVVGVAPDAMLLVLPADHVIRDTEGFVTTVMAALPAAERGRIVVFGIKPSEASTSFGYIRPGARRTGMAARTVDAFVKKPDKARAATFVASGYLWNSGIFLMGGHHRRR
jgi:mannose-1-phosphate guanylyltransferase/mannose-6-phosphate isomerase